MQAAYATAVRFHLSSATSIDRKAFDGCLKLQSVVLGDSLESIGEGAFNYCPELRRIEVRGDSVPESVASSIVNFDFPKTGTVEISTCAGLDAWNEKFMPLLPSDWQLTAREHVGEWETTVEPTCSTEGEEQRVCMCGKVETREVDPNPETHVWGASYTVDTPPTCTEAGSESIHCALCPATRDARPVAELGHDFAVYVSDANATCEEDGTETAVCAREGCTATDTRRDAGSALGHEPAGTWSHDGSSHWRACVNGCGKRLEEGAHAFEWVTDREPTAMNPGPKHEECATCGYAKANVEIPATGDGTAPIPEVPGGGSDGTHDDGGADSGGNANNGGDVDGGGSADDAAAAATKPSGVDGAGNAGEPSDLDGSANAGKTGAAVGPTGARPSLPSTGDPALTLGCIAAMGAMASSIGLALVWRKND